jgi:hypothetical protein
MWLPSLAPLAGAVVMLASYARQQRKADLGITQALTQTRRRSPKLVERRPLRWYHVLLIAMVCALPFAQWVAFLRFQTRLSFLIPLGITAGLMFVVRAFYPRFVLADPKPINRLEAGSRVGILAGALVVALLLPWSGTITVLRGALSDILAIVGVAYLIRISQSRS